MKFYLDTSIWIDIYEDRKGYNNEPLGDFGFNLILFIKSKGYKLVISDTLINELKRKYSLEQINGMFKPFEDILEKVFSIKEQNQEAQKISNKRDIPFNDVLHAILARDNRLILIARDNHFKQLKDISSYSRPEEVN